MILGSGSVSFEILKLLVGASAANAHLSLGSQSGHLP